MRIKRSIISAVTTMVAALALAIGLSAVTATVANSASGGTASVYYDLP